MARAEDGRVVVALHIDDALLAWLGPAAEQLTADQLDQVASASRQIDRRFSGDEAETRDAALTALVQDLLGERGDGPNAGPTQVKHLRPGDLIDLRELPLNDPGYVLDEATVGAAEYEYSVVGGEDGPFAVETQSMWVLYTTTDGLFWVEPDWWFVVRGQDPEFVE
jgi:hypothetical protein